MARSDATVASEVAIVVAVQVQVAGEVSMVLLLTCVTAKTKWWCLLPWIKEADAVHPAVSRHDRWIHGDAERGRTGVARNAPFRQSS
jgi:hypothetical protein